MRMRTKISTILNQLIESLTQCQWKFTDGNNEYEEEIFSATLKKLVEDEKTKKDHLQRVTARFEKDKILKELTQEK